MNRKLGLLLIALCTVVSQPALASDFGLKRGGVAASFVSPDNIDGTLGLGIYADMGTFAPRWGFETRLDWWSHSESFFDTDVSFQDVTVGARTKYMFPVSSSTVQPFAGFGLGMHFLSAEVGAFDPSTSTTYTMKSSDTKMGIDFGGGLSTHMTPSVDMNFEGWYSIVSDLDQFALRVGVSRAFGN